MVNLNLITIATNWVVLTSFFNFQNKLQDVHRPPHHALPLSPLPRPDDGHDRIHLHDSRHCFWKVRSWSSSSCTTTITGTRLGYFWKLLETQSPTKVAQILSNIWTIFYKIISESFKSSVAKFQATLENFELLGYTEQQKYLQRFANSLTR